MSDSRSPMPAARSSCAAAPRAVRDAAVALGATGDRDGLSRSIPAVTEMLFALGAGPQVVAVSSFDAYPPEVKQLPRVGALLDPERRTHPLAETGSRRRLREPERPEAAAGARQHPDLRLPPCRACGRVHDHSHDSENGRPCRAGGRSRHIGSTRDSPTIRKRVGGRAPPADAARLRPRTWRASRDLRERRNGFLDDMLRVAGGDNVFADIQREAVEASTELILSRRPT